MDAGHAGGAGASGTPRAVVLLSGGLDSATCLAWAGTRGFECHTLAVDYGQRHRIELEAARRVATALGAASHRVVAVDLRAIGGSALTADIAVPHDRPAARQPIIECAGGHDERDVRMKVVAGRAEPLGEDETKGIIEDAEFEIRDQIGWIYGSGFPKSHSLDGDWQGWGTALKPAWEPIVVARKPLVGTVIANVLTHGTGALNIDACRVATTNNLNGGAYSATRQPSNSEWVKHGGTIHNSTGKAFTQPTGRWPANIAHDGSDEVVAAFPLAPGQLADAKTFGENKTRNIYGVMRYGRSDEPSANSENVGAVGFKMKPGARRIDSGSAARFFYCAKASKHDRGEGNTHPTVKPTDLMRWLCRLVTPPGGTVLDPFMGSGSTLKAADLEGFDAIGIDLDPQYIEIARSRVSVTEEQDQIW